MLDVDIHVPYGNIGPVTVDTAFGGMQYDIVDIFDQFSSSSSSNNNGNSGSSSNEKSSHQKNDGRRHSLLDMRL